MFKKSKKKDMVSVDLLNASIASERQAIITAERLRKENEFLDQKLKDARALTERVIELYQKTIEEAFEDRNYMQDYDLIQLKSDIICRSSVAIGREIALGINSNTGSL